MDFSAMARKEAMKTDTAWQNSEEGRICTAEKDAGFSN